MKHTNKIFMSIFMLLAMLLPTEVWGKAFFLNTNSHIYWEQESAHFVAAYTLTTNESNWIITDAAVKIADHIFCVTIPDENISKIKFRRVNPNNHNTQWNPSAEYTYDQNKNCIRITQWDNSSVYETYNYTCPGEMYVVGGAIDGGWGNFKKFTTVSTGVYRWTGKLTANGGDNSCFKFAPQASYNNEYRAEVNNTEFVNGQAYKLVQGGDDRKFKVITTGMYTITINLTNPINQTVKITPIYYIKHNWGGSGWTWKELTDNGDGTYSCEGVYNASGCNWNTQESETGQQWIEDANCTKVNSPVSGNNCTFTLNPSAGTITITKKTATPTYEDLTANYYFRGDLWLDGNGWISENNRSTILPKFVKAADNKSATLKVLQPDFKIRFTLYESATKKQVNSYWNAEETAASNITNTNAGQATDNSIFEHLGSTKMITYTLTKINGNLHLVANADDYTVKKDGWDLYVDGNLVGTTDANGEVIASNLTGTSSGTEHLFYFTDGSASADLRFGVNKFGGLYVDQANSESELLSLKQYYKSSSIGTYEAPISNNSGSVGYYDATGRIKLTSNSDVKFTFDGGKITINKVAAVTLPDNLYVYGCGGTNFFTGCWNNNLPAYKMTVADGEATYTFHNVSGSTSMKIRDHEANVDRDKDYITEQAQNMTTIIKSITKGSGNNNIDLSLNGVADLTIHYNGTKIWFTAERAATPVAGNEWYIMGSGNSWVWDKNTKTDHNRMTITDGVASVSYTGVSGNLAFKVFRASDNAEFNCSYYDAEASTGKKFSNLANDNICLNGLTHADVTIFWDGTKIWTNVTDYQTIPGDYYLRGWYDGWDQGWVNNKFTKVGDYKQTFTLLITPSTEPNTNAFKATQSGWKEMITYDHVDQATCVNYTKATDGDQRIYVNPEVTSRVTFIIWKDADGNRKMSIEVAPAQTHTVTYQNGQLSTTREVADGEKATALSMAHRGVEVDWYDNEACTGAAFDFNTPITEPKTLYAKSRGASGSYFLTGAIWHNWTNENKTPQMNVTDGVATYTFIAPVGQNTIRTLKGSRNEGDYIDARYFDAANSATGIKISGDNKQLYFTIADQPKQVTVTFDGAIRVQIEDYTPHYVDPMYITTNGNWAKVWQADGTPHNLGSWDKAQSYAKLRQNGDYGYLILRDVQTGERIWKLLASNNDDARSGEQLFNAMYVDYANSVSVAGNFEWTMTNCDPLGRQLSYSEATWRNIRFNVKKQCQLKIVFDGGLIRVMDLPQYTVSFNTNGGSAIDAKTVYEEERVSAPAAPTKPLHKFKKWQLNGEDFDFANTPITDNITLDAVYEAASLSIHGPLWVESESNHNYRSANTPDMTNDGTTATVSLVAPKGYQTFGILRDRSYDHQIKPTCDNQSGNVELSRGDDMWFHFTLDEASFITITYTADNKVYVTVDPAYENKSGWYLYNDLKATWGKTAMDNGELIMRDIQPGLDRGYDFKVTGETDDNALAGISYFGSPYVEMNTEDFWQFTYTGEWNQTIPQVNSDKQRYWRNATVKFTEADLINNKLDLHFSFDGKTIQLASVEHVSVTCKLAAEGETFATQLAFKGNKAIAPANPEARADGAAFVEWRKEGETVAFDWSTTIDEDITLIAFWDVLQDRADATAEGGTLILEHDYFGGDLEVHKSLTIAGNGHQIGNLTVTNSGNLTLASGLTVNNFYLQANGASHTSGQILSPENLTVQANAYFDLTLENEHIQFGWYDFCVPFAVDVMSGITGIDHDTKVEKTTFANEVDYAVMEHQGALQAQGQYPYKKFRGTMKPSRLYSITLDDEANFTTVRFRKAVGAALVSGNSVTLGSYAGATEHANWNGVGNGTLRHADAGVSAAHVQIYNTATRTFTTYATSDASLVVGTAVMVQATGTMTLDDATHSTLLAPARAAAEVSETYAIELRQEASQKADRLFYSASEEAEGAYTIGRDLMKAGNIGNVQVPQLWINAYGQKLCVHEAEIANMRAESSLSLYAPAAGEYTLEITALPDSENELYLTENGRPIWNLTMAPITLDLERGTNSQFGLRLFAKPITTVTTDLQGAKLQGAETFKYIENGILYLRTNGRTVDATGRVAR